MNVKLDLMKILVVIEVKLDLIKICYGCRSEILNFNGRTMRKHNVRNLNFVQKIEDYAGTLEE